ncbi:MAG: DUF928 domain-containing protein [Fischerella sp. CENA71]|nr:DUF928 domain-containing protein [Fischerella sp. CENA71]
MTRLQRKGLFILSWVLFSWVSCSIHLVAWAENQTSNDRKSEVQIHFISVEKDPPNRGTPPAKEGTGSRGNCIYKEDMPPLTRVVGDSQLKLTTKGYPTFWVYLPYTSQEATNGEFSLQDGDSEIFRIRFQLPAKSGIVGISLPSTIPALVVGKEYRWYFDINCSASVFSGDSPTPASVTGLVQRISISAELERELKTAKTPLEQIVAYAKHGIWYETVTELAQLRLQEPNNSTFKKVWIELLTTENIGLKKVSQEPIVGNITLEVSKMISE